MRLEPSEWQVDTELQTPEQCLSLDRVRRYGDGLYTATAGEPRTVGHDIHTDEGAAQRQGLPAAVVDGMMSTNLISSMLVRAFGLPYLEGGELTTKFIRPVPVGTVVRAGARIEEVERAADGTLTARLTVWMEDTSGALLTVGDAAVSGLSRSGVGGNGQKGGNDTRGGA